MPRIYDKETKKQIGVEDKKGRRFYFDKKLIKNPPAEKDIEVREAGK